MSKIKSLDELVAIRENARSRGKKVVFVNGYFQTLHPGHISFLSRAKDCGDVLIVGINSDKSLRCNKGFRTSAEDEGSRATMISAIEAVDRVCIFDDLTPFKLISKLQPDVLVKGDNYDLDDVLGKDVVQSYGGKVILLPFDRRYNSDDIVRATHGSGFELRCRTRERDISEYFKQIDSFLDLAEIIGSKRRIISSEMKRFIRIRYNGGYIHPFTTGFSTQIYREGCNLIDNGDPYAHAKITSNSEAQRLAINFNPHSLAERLRLAILGNLMDYGACLDGSHLNLEDVKHKFESLNILEIDHTDELEKKIEEVSANKGRIFYLVDNSGEIIFDKFMLEYLREKVGQNNLFIVGKEKPMQTDLTANELKELGYEQYGQIVSTGSDCFGLHEEEVSEEFIELFKTADLVIAKGQAYMEFFREYDWANVFNVLMVKFPMDVGPYKLPAMKGVVIDSRRYASRDGSGLIYPIEKLRLVSK